LSFICRVKGTPAGKRDGAGKGGSPEGGRREGGEGRSKQKVWLRGPQGEPAPVEVKAGITDGTFSELVEGELKEGDEVIVGVDMPKGPHGSSLPPGFGSQPSQRPSTGTPRGM
jgi:HlyD family secretion protein